MTLTDHAVLPAALVEAQAVDGSRQAVAISGAALRLPMSPEVEPRYGHEPGAAVLAAVARESGGIVRADVAGIFDNPPSPGSGTDLAVWLVVAALVLLVAEITVRRLRVSWAMPRLPSLSLGKTVFPHAGSTKATTPKVNSPAPMPLPSAAQSAAAPVPPVASGGLHDALSELKRRKGR